MGSETRKWVSFIKANTYYVDGRVMDVRDHATAAEAREVCSRHHDGGWGEEREGEITAHGWSGGTDGK